jgi:branched-chain amino acid transport system permease protein
MLSAMAEYIIFGASISATWILIASGFTLLYGVTKIINIAYGLSYALSAYLLYYLVRVIGLGTIPAAPLSMLGAIVVDLVVFILVVKPIMKNHELTMTATFLLAITATQSFLLLFSPQPRGVPTVVSGSIIILGVNVVLQRLALIPVSIASLIILHLFLKKSRPGKVIRAVSQDDIAAKLLGIDIQRYHILTVLISSTLASLAGVFFVSLEVVSPTTILDPIVAMFTVTILGGLGNLPGAIMAGLLLGYSETAAVYLFGSQFRGILPLLVAIIAMQIKPYGLLGRR